jgi:D-glycero-D-manno-heptose 1,7-bisphosphate phosphatase
LRKQPAVFLDRDGVINEDSYDYVKSWDEFRFRTDTLESLRQLHEAAIEAYVITNQSGVGRGYFSERMLLGILTRMRMEIAAAGGLIHGIEYCPHGPDEGCWCRKPQPGSLFTAAAKYGLDLRRSVFVGDSCGDINAGHAAGCITIFLTTRSELQPQRPLTPGPSPMRYAQRRRGEEQRTTGEGVEGGVRRAYKPPYITKLSRQLRSRSTAAEQRMWRCLRARRLLGHKFRRQHPLGRYVADFYCHERGLVLEINGEVHARTKEDDRIRQEELERRGARVLRFTNSQVFNELPTVIADIVTALGGPYVSQQPLTPGPSPMRCAQRRRGEEQRLADENRPPLSPREDATVSCGGCQEQMPATDESHLPSPSGRGVGGERPHGSGPGPQVTEHLSRCIVPPDYVAESLSQAVDIILALPGFAQQ